METKKKMLVVDDNLINRQIIGEIFKDEFTIFEASDGYEAFDIIHNDYEDLAVIVLDLFMPRKDGFSVLKDLQSDPDYYEIPVVVISGENEPEIQLKALDMGAKDFILKPFNASIVYQRVINVVHNHDYTAYKIENELLKKQTADQVQLQAIMRNYDGGICLVNYDEDDVSIFFANEGFYSLTGYSNLEFTNKSVSEDLGPGELAILSKNFRKINRSHGFFEEILHFNKGDKTALMKVKCSWIPYPESNKPVFLVLIADVTKEKEIEQKNAIINEQLKYRAQYDLLTGIYNKEMFYLKCREYIDEHPEDEITMIRLNVDRFSMINDLFGKQKGDEVLKDLASALTRMVNSQGVTARLEGASFGICIKKKLFNVDILLGISSMKLANMDYNVRLSCGIYEINDRTLPIDAMCDRTLLALQAIKNNYSLRYAYYDESIRTNLLIEESVVERSELALKNHEFCIYLQPVHSVSTGAVCSAEALVRWIHPEKGIVSPGVFIPVFEKNGFIVNLDKYVWEEVCRLQRDRINKGLCTFPISTNISRITLYIPHLAKEINDIVDRYEIPHNLIRFEITESAYNANIEQILTTINELKEYGFKILMDDFGSGYSSLNILKDIPIDILKLDMRFFENFEESIKASNIVQFVIKMAKAIDIDIVAEGVETETQKEFLSENDCDKIQGYYYSRPLPLSEFETYFEKYHVN